MKRLIYILLLLLCSLSTLRAQSTLGISQGVGWGTIRAYPSIVTKPVYGLYTTSIEWRHYSASRYVGGFGIDVEFMQRGFAYAPYTTENNTDDDKKESDLLYYTRNINSIMVPIIWQPHIYALHNRVRIFGDAAVTFSYNYSSSYQNDLYHSYGYEDDWKGEYEMRTERDNSFGYGLAFGGGIAYLHGRCEIHASMRYYFGYSDILKNRNKYYGNETDGPENPFSYTPQRSPLDNFNFKVGISYRLGKEDFASWYSVRLKSTGLRDGFQFEGEEENKRK
ncbi:MAG: outer membrane beta-barrel protein [Rikenellaceae bacterium]